METAIHNLKYISLVSLVSEKTLKTIEQLHYNCNTSAIQLQYSCNQ